MQKYQNSMKKLIIAIICFCNYTVFSQKQTPVNEILLLLDNQTKAWNMGDLDDFMAGYWHNDSLVFIGKSGLTYGFEKTLANYKRNYPDKATLGKLDFDIKKIEKINRKNYFVIGKWHLERIEKGDLSGHYSLFLKKIDGKWQIVSDHSS
jgi:hypothetical protein